MTDTPSKIDLLKSSFPGCRARIEGSGACKYHVSTPLAHECFASKAQLLKRVAPMGDIAALIVREDIDPIAAAILRLSLDAHDCRGDYPQEPPEMFVRDRRLFNGAVQYGWTPTWSGGLTYENWSYRKGLENNPAWLRFNQAARSEVAEQIMEIRSGCGIGNAHVHHAAPWHFRRLVDTFLAGKGIQYQDVVLKDYGLAYWFADPDLGYAWQEFHAMNATLIALSVEDHTAAHRNEANGLRWDGVEFAHGEAYA